MNAIDTTAKAAGLPGAKEIWRKGMHAALVLFQ